MFNKTQLTVLTLAIGIAIGLSLTRTSIIQPAIAQNGVKDEVPNKILVRGHGRAISSLGPPGEQFKLIPSNAPDTSFKIVPRGKKFVLTDVLYQPQQNVRERLTVNIADFDPSDNSTSILFQVQVEPNKSDQLNVCSGYVIRSGHGLAARTNAGLMREQYVSISITGYLADE